MTNDELGNFAMFAALLNQENPEASIRHVAEHALNLRAIARRIKARGIRDCNTGNSPRREELDDRDYAAAQEIADHYGAKVQRMRDVRGFALKLIFKSGRYNSTGGAESGWGVPE